MEVIEAFVVVQARMSSTRLPGKTMAIVNGKPIIYWQIKRILKSKNSIELIVATSDDKSDDPLADYLESEAISVYRGSLNNVYSRYRNIVKNSTKGIIVRSTADCPFFMPDLLDTMLASFVNSSLDYLSNTLIPTYPDGLDIEIFKASSLLDLDSNPMSDREIEHVTYGIYSNPGKFKTMNFPNVEDLSDLRWTLDHPQDLEFVIEVYNFFKGRELDFKMHDLLDLLAKNADLKSKIPGNRRNEQLKESKIGNN